MSQLKTTSGEDFSALRRTINFSCRELRKLIAQRHKDKITFLMNKAENTITHSEPNTPIPANNSSHKKQRLRRPRHGTININA